MHNLRVQMDLPVGICLWLMDNFGVAISLKTGLSQARSEPGMRYSLEKTFDYVISRLVALRKLTELADIRPDPRHLRGQ